MQPLVLSDLASIATIAAAIIAIISLIYIARQAGAVREQVKQIGEQTDVVKGIREQIGVVGEYKKLDRTYDYLKRYGDPNFRPIAAEAINFLKREDITLANKWKILEDKDDPKHVDLKSKVVYTLNFFEELGVMYNRDLTDKEIVKVVFKDPSLKYTEYATRYIAYRRKEIPGVYVEWEKIGDNFP
ncbi:hypothetical protein ES703_81445 [subsurface metagenome]